MTLPPQEQPDVSQPGRHRSPGLGTRPSVSVWLTHPLNGLTLALIGWVAWPLVATSTDGLRDLPDVILSLGMLAVPVVAFLWSGPHG
ncbi:hypothetical protein [Terrabacter sp. 2YAF2]|uniref:hypothetical protein n=1 Tax=Terrabacter sp. 2YAF2 TaxID=3233026 RepID=UPI003F97DBB6